MPWDLLMAPYPDLAHLVHAVDPSSSERGFTVMVEPYLVSAWLDDA